MKCLIKYRTTVGQKEKEAYYKERKEYQYICKVMHMEYYRNLERRLDTITDNKARWKIANEIRHKETTIGCHITADSLRAYFASLLNPDIQASFIQYEYL